MRRVLTLVGWSIGLPFADFVERTGLATDLVDPLDVEPGVLERGGYDAVFAAGHPASSLTPDRSWGDAIYTFVAEGGGLVACRAATEWFSGWDEWNEFLGARLAPGEVALDLTEGAHHHAGHVEFASRRHPVVAGLEPMLDLTQHLPRYRAADDTDVLAQCGSGTVVWSTRRGAGRIVVDALAYDADSLSLPANRTILQRALRWVGES